MINSVLILSTFIAGLCSLVYELLISTTSSYFLGDSVKQFSITIGLYMAAMGIGAFMSRYVKENHLLRFIQFELLLGLVGGMSIPILYLSFAYTNYYYAVMVLLIMLVGILTGLEVPLLTLLLKSSKSLSLNLSLVLSVDYIGALAGTLLFPFILLPFTGLFRGSLITGLLNLAIALLMIFYFKKELEDHRRPLLMGISSLAIILIASSIYFSEGLLKSWNRSLYTDRVVYSEQTPYQQIVLTKNKADLRLFINGALQFSSIDEYRYHESLIHIPFSYSSSHTKVLVLGGGDGLAVREILRYPTVESITLVDLDPAITSLAQNNPHLLTLNKASLLDQRVSIIHQDAMRYLLDTTQLFDQIIIDLPDPNNVSLARLYSHEFYGLVKRHLNPTGIMTTQATSPFFAPLSYWSISKTIRSASYQDVRPYHANVPSFGEWGFVMAGNMPFKKGKLKKDLRYLDNNTMSAAFKFSPDLIRHVTKTSTLDSPVVLQHYLSEWKYWN
jgi:spermidine synthase